MRFPFALKLASAVAALTLSITGFAVGVFYFQSRQIVLAQMRSHLQDVGHTGTFLFREADRRSMEIYSRHLLSLARPRTQEFLSKIADGSTSPSLDPAATEKEIASPEFQKFIQILRSIRNGSTGQVAAPRALRQENRPDEGVPQLYSVYLIVPIPESPDYRYVMFLADSDFETLDRDHDNVISSDEEGNPPGNIYAGEEDALARPFLDGKPYVSDTWYTDRWGTTLSASIPIKDGDGRVIACLGLDYLVTSGANQLSTMLYLSFGILGMSLLLAVTSAALLARIVSRPLRQFKTAAEAVRRRDFGVTVQVKSRDEFGVLAGAFNGMVREIRDYASGLEELNRAYFRFVPREFLQHLEKSSLAEVKLGDQVQKEMTVLFSDIKAFTTISESMTPADNFAFINRYLSFVSPVIRRHGGFVDKYIGDAVMALFPASPVEAIEAALEMQKALGRYNVERRASGRPPVEAGTGIHTGTLMLGTIGEEERMESTVISDAVNLASRMEGLTRIFGVPILVSQQMRSAAGERYHFRYLGTVKIKGKIRNVRVYELLEADPPEIQKRKLETLPEFERGVSLFEQGRFDEARASFAGISVGSGGDSVLQIFLHYCDHPQEAVHVLQ